MAVMDGIALPARRQKLVSLIREAGDVITVDAAVAALSVDRAQAAKTLSRWARQGWLRRVRRGAYVHADISLLDSEGVLDDPWLLVPALYGPAYVGGWTAAAHWDLTEQLFQSVAVMTARAVRRSADVRHFVKFELHHVKKEDIFGTKTILCQSTRVQVSDLHRTIVDMFNDLDIGCGVQQVADCFREYLRHPDRSDGTLIDYADRLGNGAVFKRLGFVAEHDREGTTAALVDACRSRLTKGYAKFSYPGEGGLRLHSRWRLRVSRHWKGWSPRGY